MDWQGWGEDTGCVISVISLCLSSANDTNCNWGFRGQALRRAGGQEELFALLNSSWGRGSGHFATSGPSSPSTKG